MKNSMMLTLTSIEKELQKRLSYPYRWHTKQTNDWDKKTNFIYQKWLFDEVIVEIDKHFRDTSYYQEIKDYTLNRWYNFWSAWAVERLFCQMHGVMPFFDAKNKLIDFTVQGIPFDHKTSIFPRNYTHSLEYAIENPRDLIVWLYQNQSQEQRKHFHNRLFVVLYAADHQHWKLKANISLLEKCIQHYTVTFSPKDLHSISFEPSQTTLSDIIWVIEC